jgi:CHASE2 domain-containing sensor protein
MLKMFCEADGTPSMRRVLAFLCFIAFVGLGVAAYPSAAAGWFVFIPSALALLAMILLLFFTTWADVAEIVRAAKGG